MLHPELPSATIDTLGNFTFFGQNVFQCIQEAGKYKPYISPATVFTGITFYLRVLPLYAPKPVAFDSYYIENV